MLFVAYSETGGENVCESTSIDRIGQLNALILWGKNSLWLFFATPQHSAMQSRLIKHLRMRPGIV